MDGDIMKMHRLEAVEIPAHGSAVLRPGSHHLMLIGLKQPLHEGERFPLTLTFEKAGTITVEITVEGIASTIGRATCRERVCQYVSNSLVAVSLKKHKKN